MTRDASFWADIYVWHNDGWIHFPASGFLERIVLFIHKTCDVQTLTFLWSDKTSDNKTCYESHLIRRCDNQMRRLERLMFLSDNASQTETASELLPIRWMNQTVKVQLNLNFDVLIHTMGSPLTSHRRPRSLYWGVNLIKAVRSCLVLSQFWIENSAPISIWICKMQQMSPGQTIKRQ